MGIAPVAGNPVLPVLTTARLVLAPLEEDHLDRFLRVAGERAVADGAVSIPHPLTERDARAWIDRAVCESAQGRAAHFAIAIRPDCGTLVGYTAIEAIDGVHGEGTLGFLMETRHSGQGYITEAEQAMLRFGFDELRLNRICAYTLPRNPASARVLEKLGFQQEGRLRQRVRRWGVYEDVFVWSRLRRDLVIAR